MGISYTWDEGKEDLKTAERPAVFVRKVGCSYVGYRLLIIVYRTAEWMECLISLVISLSYWCEDRFQIEFHRLIEIWLFPQHSYPCVIRITSIQAPLRLCGNT